MSTLKIRFSYSLLVLAALVITACQHSGKCVESNDLPAIFPDYVDVTVPVDIAPLNFAMLDDSLTRMVVVVTGDKGGRIEVEGDYADFPIDEWQALLGQNRGGKLSVSVKARGEGKVWTAYLPFSINVSTDSLGDKSIAYRRIAPGYQLYGHMGIYQRTLATFDEVVIEDNSNQPGTCLNCHTSNRGNAAQHTYHRRGNNAGTFVEHEQMGRYQAEPSKELGGSMVYPYWHPSGRYIAYSTNKTSQMFHLANAEKRIEVYDSQSDVFVYDVLQKRELLDTLIMRRLWAENTPAFSPDGRWLYFTTARRQVYPTDYNRERYSLCRVAFDEQTGRLGQHVDTLLSGDTISISWPRPSYDGRYIMFTTANHGYFTIWHPEADLWLLDLETGATRPLTEVNSPRAESFHNWSNNSRWFLFTSRRGDGLYSRIYFSSLTPDGKATKPFLLPQRNPKVYDRTSLYSFNTPEFLIK